MKIIKKITITLLIAIISLFSITSIRNEVQAASISEIISGANDFVNKGEADQENTIDRAKLKEGANLIYSIFFAIGFFLATVVGIIVGIKLMAAGTASEKAQYKKVIEVYLAGCIVIFGAGGIWKLVIDTVNGVTPTATTQSQPATQTQPVKKLTEEEQYEEFMKNLTPAQESKIRSRAIQKMKDNGMNTTPSSGATSVPGSQAVDIPDSYYEEAAKEIMKEE